MFGLDGDQVERSLGRQCVNMGLCLIFPLDYLFEEIRSNVKAGDIIVLSPEYSSYSEQTKKSDFLADILDPYPRGIEWMLKTSCCTLDQKSKFVFHLRTVGLEKLTFAIKHLGSIINHTCKWTKGKYDPALDVLRASHLDRSGALLWHLNQKCQSDPHRADHLDVSTQLDQDVISDINNFNQYCKARGAQLVLIPPPVAEPLYRQEAPEIEKLMADCDKHLKCPILARPSRYTFPFSMIFNDQYHLNKYGRPIRTQRVIEDLRAICDKQVEK